MPITSPIPRHPVPAPPVALTLGDVAGIGPEIVAKTLAARAAGGAPMPLVVGPLHAMREAARRWAPGLRVQVVDEPPAAAAAPGVLPVLPVGDLPEDHARGAVSAATGRAAAQAVERAVALALAGRVAAVCTAPLHKEALAAAGVPFPGHTEMLAALCGARDIAMMLATPRLRVMLVTVHCALADAIRRLSAAEELRVIRLAARTLRAMGVAQPRIAVAGLNPHAGEGGLFGREDLELIAPAVAAARAEGLDASGPWPGDTVFMQARAGRFDLVVAQYHDQGLIPVKLLGLADGVNITAGLPFVRTSPDHGTAFDIAWKGEADPASLANALALAERLAAGTISSQEMP